MIDPVALLVLADDATVTTPARECSAARIAVDDVREHDPDTIQVRNGDASLLIAKGDIQHCIDLTDLAFRPVDLDVLVENDI